MKNTNRILLILFFIVFSFKLYSQDSSYKSLKKLYDTFQNQGEQDSSLHYAQKINKWVQKNWSDTSLYYAVSYRYIGNCFLAMNKLDSAQFYYDMSIQQLKIQKREFHSDYATCLNNIGNLKRDLGDLITAETYLTKGLNLRLKLFGENHSDVAASFNNLGILYYNMLNFKLAEENYLNSLKIKLNLTGNQNTEYASSLNNLGNLYAEMGKYDKADSCFKNSFDIFNSQLDSLHPYRAVILENYGNYHYELGNFKTAKFNYEKCFSIRKKIFSEENPEFISGLINLGALSVKLAQFSEAESYLNQASIFVKKKSAEDSLMYALIQNSLGNLYFEKGDYKKAELYYQSALDIRGKVVGVYHPDYGMSLGCLGSLNEKIGDFDKAHSFYKQALEIRRKCYGKDHPLYATSLNQLADFFMNVGELEQSLIYLDSATKIRVKIVGDKHPDYASSLISVGLLCLKKNDFKCAKKYYQEALEIRLNAFGKNHPTCANSFNNLGVLFYSMGDLKKAQDFYVQALEIREKTLGSFHISYGISLNNLGNLNADLGNFKDAKSYIESTIKVFEKSLGKSHPYYISSINNLGTICLELGDNKTAEENFLLAEQLLISSFNYDTVEIANIYNNLGILYRNIGDFTNSYIFLKKALDFRGNYFLDPHIDYAVSLNNLGDLFLETKRYKFAEEYFFKALEILKKVLNDDNLYISKILSNIGLLQIKKADFKSSEFYLKQSCDIIQKILGEDHPDYLSTMNSFAYLLLNTNREKDAFAIFNNNFSKKSKQIADNFEWLSDNQKEAYWKKESAFYDNLSLFANEAFEKVPEAVALNYNAALVSKSKMLEAKISSENYYREVDELRGELAYRRRLLAKMESDGSTEKEKLEKLRKEADSIDNRLTLSWPDYAQQKKNLSITWGQVQQNLEKGEAAIEFVRFKNEDDSVVYYNALVLKKGDQNPTLVKLCKEKDLQTITPKMGYSAYYPLVWQPIEAALKDVKTIYYAPTGELYNVPFHAIYAPKGKGDEVLASKTDKRGVIIQNERAATEQNAEYLMDRYTMHQLTSTRYLAMGLKQKAKEPIRNAIAMVGGVNYDYLPGSSAASKKNKKDKNAKRSSATASGKLPYLEGTKIEVEKINQQVTTATWQTKLIENNEAIEENITKMEGKEAKGILHLATHGYAFPEYDFKDTMISKNSLRYSYRYSTNPMVRSGLILAGGNWAWTGSDTLSKLGAEQNGILTALEVSQLNLKNTKLVVLSACETGLGKIEGSEGTFGLKRGFKLAGVEQMIVSLWSVPDKETMELMTLFYSDLTKTLNPVNSFEKAQKEMRNKYPTDPEKWAGFVLVR